MRRSREYEFDDTVLTTIKRAENNQQKQKIQDLFELISDVKNSNEDDSRSYQIAYNFEQILILLPDVTSIIVAEMTKVIKEECYE